MEDVLGAHTDPNRFAAFLDDWEAILAQRVDQTVSAFASIPGVRGMILAGSIGRGEAWPLSDIDLLPIYEDELAEDARFMVERLRIELLDRWAGEGWWTGIDVGNLVFGRDEVGQTLGAIDASDLTRLRDTRWYHSVDKGYRGRAVYDPSGDAARLVQWFTARRFRADVVRLRLERERAEFDLARQRLQEQREKEDLLGAAKALLAVVHWLRTWLLESWGERDNSLGRLGTRFERAARARGRPDLIEAINALSDLDEAAAAKRMAAAPWWVGERHARQWGARRHIGEEVTRDQDVRDVLRVCARYGIGEVTTPPFPVWLAIPENLDALDAKLGRLSTLASECFADDR